MRPQIIYKPIAEWPGELRMFRKHDQFSVSWPTTENDLIDEVFALQPSGTSRRDLLVTIQVATDDIIRDASRLHAKANLRHPGVIVNFGSRLGEVQLWADAFYDWRANVRGVALALEAMRKIDRYGVGRGDEQYQGWLALDAGTGSGGSETDEQFIATLINWPLSKVQENRDAAGRTALLCAHPDRGGTHEAIVRVNAIRERWAS